MTCSLVQSHIHVFVVFFMTANENMVTLATESIEVVSVQTKEMASTIEGSNEPENKTSCGSAAEEGE